MLKHPELVFSGREFSHEIFFLNPVNRVESAQPNGNSARQVLRQWLKAGGCFFGGLFLLYTGSDAEELFGCANCWPARHLISVDVSKNRARWLLWWFFMATTGHVGAKSKVMLPRKRTSCRADSSCCCV